MTTIDFHTGAAEPLAMACRLLRKAVRQGVRVQVTAAEPALRELDRLLWVFREREFLPHVRLPGAAAALAARTPVWLLPEARAEDAPAVLLNLDGPAPQQPERFERIIEIVSDEPEEAARGRERWRSYKARGLVLKHHAPASDA